MQPIKTPDSERLRATTDSMRDQFDALARSLEDKLTPLMLKALTAAGSPKGLGSWDYASGVLSGLKKRGLVVRQLDGRYSCTTEGLAVLRRSL